MRNKIIITKELQTRNTSLSDLKINKNIWQLDDNMKDMNWDWRSFWQIWPFYEIYEWLRPITHTAKRTFTFKKPFSCFE